MRSANQNEFFSSLLEARFSIVVVLGGQELRWQDIVGGDRDTQLLWGFEHVEILPFGYRLRSEFVKQWYRLGRSIEEDDDQAIRRVIEVEEIISQLLGRDLLPPYPMYLLLLLQQMETAQQLNTASASLGHLYNGLIVSCLLRIGDKVDLDARLNYLSELAYHLFCSKAVSLDDTQALKWHGQYCAKYDYPLDYQGLRADLTKANILNCSNGQTRFRYRALYYYFVAVYMAGHMSEEVIRLQVKTLCGKLYSEDGANILLFICHLSKDSLVLSEVLATANRLFAGVEPADVCKDGQFAVAPDSSVSAMVLTSGDPETNRQALLERKDLAEAHEDRNDEMYAHTREEESEDESEIRRQIAHINASFKTIQIVGQILRNFAGSLIGQTKLELTLACYHLAMRNLKYFLTITESVQDDLLAGFTQFIKGRSKSIDNVKATQMANTLLFGLVDVVTFGIIKHVSNSVGLERLGSTFDQALEADGSNSVRLITLSIRLDHYKGSKRPAHCVPEN